MKKGSKQTEKAKEKNRLAHLGKIPWNKGLKTGLTSEHQKAVASARWMGENNPQAINPRMGEDHPNWKGGPKNKKRLLRGRKEWSDWRKIVFERDGYKCVDCGLNGYLEPHHIVPLKEDESLAFDVNNGITLCRKCHQNTFGKEMSLVSTYKSLLPIVR